MSGPLLRSTVARYRCVTGATWPDGTGALVHAAFLSGVQRVNSGLGSRLHGSSAFTTAVISGPPDEQAHPVGATEMRFPLGGELELRFTSIDNELSGLLDSVVRGSPHLRLGPVRLELSAGPFTAPAQHPHAVAGEAEEIGRYWLEAHGRSDRPIFGKASAHFLTPTVFRKDGADVRVPMPLPDLVFARLRRVWNSFGIREITQQDGILLADTSSVTAYDLRCGPVRVGRGRTAVGFTGWCEITFGSDDAARLGHLLLDLAFFAGVGAKTGMGCGAIAPVNHYGVLQPATAIPPKEDDAPVP